LYSLSKKEGYFLGNNNSNGTIGGLRINTHKVFCSKTRKNLYYKFGIGLSRSVNYFNSMVTLKEAQIAPIDSVRIGEVLNRSLNMNLPIVVWYEFPNLFKKGLGLGFSLGIESKIRLNNEKVKSKLTSDFDFAANRGNSYYNEAHNALTNKKFENLLKPFSAQLSFGFSMIDNTYTSGGLKFFMPLISPFSNTLKVKTELGATVFLRNSFSNPFRKK
jgi:hypothetical protein